MGEPRPADTERDGAVMRRAPFWRRAVLLLLTVGLFLALTVAWLALPGLFARRIAGSGWTWAMASGLAAWAWFLVALALLPAGDRGGKRP